MRILISNRGVWREEEEEEVRSVKQEPLPLARAFCFGTTKVPSSSFLEVNANFSFTCLVWTCVPGPPSTYDVRTNDTLSSIAINFNITLDALVAVNTQIENIDLIFPQQIINVPICPNSQCTFSTHVIRSGDIFFDLAATYGSTTGQILAANVGVDPAALQVGQQIVLPLGCGNFTPLAI